MDIIKALWNDFVGIVGDTVTLGTNPTTTLNIIVWSLFIGFMLAIGVTVYNRLVIGPMIKRLIERKAFCEETAIPAAEAGCTNPFIRFAMRRNGSLRRLVRLKGDTDQKQGSVSVSDACLYIPDDRIRRAETLYGIGGMSAGSVLLAILVFFAIAILSFIVVPDLITMLSNFIEGITPESNIL